MTSALSQRGRLGLLALDVAVLLVCSRIGFGHVIPLNDDRGIWFYTALLGLVLGSRLDTPFFVTPADVIVYAAPAAVALLLANSWASWPAEVRAMFAVALGFCGLCVALGILAIVTHGTNHERWQRTSNAARILAETVGTPRTIYSVVVAFALFAFHRNSTREFTTVAVAWMLTGVWSPVEATVFLLRRLRRAFHRTEIVGQDGEVVAFQTPGILLIRQTRATSLLPGTLVAVRDVIGSARMALVLDNVGRDEGILVRAIEQSPTDEQRQMLDRAVGLETNGIACLPSELVPTAGTNVQRPAALVGLVAPDTSIERLYFEVVADDELEEGRLVEVRVRTAPVLYQVVNGLNEGGNRSPT